MTRLAEIEDDDLTALQWDQLFMLRRMWEMNYPIYTGTANPKKVATRRAKNRVAKQSRKINR